MSFTFGVLTGAGLTIVGSALFLFRYGHYATTNDQQAQTDLNLVGIWTQVVDSAKSGSPASTASSRRRTIA